MAKTASEISREKIESAKSSYNKRQYLQAAVFAAEALDIARNNSLNDLIKEIKPLLREYNNHAEKNLTSHEIKVDVNENESKIFEKMINEFTASDSLEENLIKIISSRILVPRYDQVEKNAKNIVPVTAQLTTHYSFGDDGNLHSMDDFENTWLMENYGIALNLSNGLIIETFINLELAKKLNKDAIIDLVISRGTLKSEQVVKLDTVLLHKQSADYLSAMHIMVPLFESIFLHLSKLLGLDTTAIKSRKKLGTRNSNLSTHLLNSAEIQKAWGRDYCKLIDIYLVNDSGYRMRHKIAHGEISLSECNYGNYSMLLFLMLKCILMVRISSN